MMTFGNALQVCLKEKYVDFNGRARRSEYWWFALFTWAGTIFLSFIDNLVFGVDASVSILSSIWGLAILLPSLAVGVRRLHDLEKSGWWLLLSLIPLIGFLVLLFWFVKQGTDGQNRFGADPLN